MQKKGSHEVRLLCSHHRRAGEHICMIHATARGVVTFVWKRIEHDRLRPVVSIRGWIQVVKVETYVPTKSRHSASMKPSPHSGGEVCHG